MGPFFSSIFRPLRFLLACLAFTPLSAQTVSTVAGNATPGYSGEGGPVTLGELYGPGDVLVDGAGNLVFSEAPNVVVRKAVLSGATTLLRLAGQPSVGGNSGDGGDPLLATFIHPAAVAIDSAGNIFVADFDSHVVRRINSTGTTITRYAGTGTGGFSGDNGSPTSAQLLNPLGLAVDASDNLYICEYGNHRIRRVNAAGTTIITYAGNGSIGNGGNGGPATAASFGVTLERIALDQAGNLYIADSANFMVRRVASASGTITAYAGNGSPGTPSEGGLALSQPLNSLDGLTLDCVGNLFIVDDTTHVVRKVEVGTGVITTVAGAGGTGYQNGAALSALFHDLEGITHDRQGNLYLADYENHSIRRVSGVAATCTPLPTATPTRTSTPTPTRTQTPTQTPTPLVPTQTSTSTLTQTSTLTASPTETPSPTVTLTPTLTPVVPPCGAELLTYAYPNPVQGPTVTLHAELCQAGRVTLWVYNTALLRVASFEFTGQAGPNDFVLDLSGFSHGIYHYLLRSDGPSGQQKAPVGKFAVTSP